MIARAIVSVILLLANAFFVAAEFAFVAAQETHVQNLAAQGNKRAERHLLGLRRLSLMLAGAQLGITMASLGLGFVAEPLFADLITTSLQNVGVTLPTAVLHTLSFVLALSVVTFLHMVFGEMVPKNIAITTPVRSALALTIPFQLFVKIFRPLIGSLNALANIGVRLMGVAPVDEIFAVHDADQIARMLEDSREEGAIADFEHRLLNDALRFGAKDAADVMVSRMEVVTVDLHATPAEIERVVVEKGHSRIPVCDTDFDHIVGLVYAKDLLEVGLAERDQAISPDLLRKAWVVPSMRKLGPLLVDMRKHGTHIALVVNEHGSTEGIVTLEDILEELVGEIRDEYDEPEDHIRMETENFIARGILRPDEIEREIGLSLPAGEYDTLGGFLLDQLGRIPEAGDEIEYGGWTLRIRCMDGHRVDEVELIPSPAGENGPV